MFATKKSPTTDKEPVAAENKIDAWITDHLTRIPMVLKMLFIYHLKTMIKAGLPIVNALQVLGQEIENKRLKKVIGKIKEGVEKGKQLSEVLALYPRVFPPIYVSMVAAGEAGGRMEEALEQIHIQMKKGHELTSKVRGAMVYPAVILVAMVGIAIEVVVFVLPKVMVMFNDFNAELPLPTKILIAITEGTQKYGIFMAIGAVAIVIGFIQLIKIPSVKEKLHAFNLLLPLAGPIIKKINLARFTLTLSSLMQSSIPIIDAVRITSEVQSNLVYKNNLLIVSEKLKKGEPLSEILAGFPKAFPPMVTEMIMVGEQSGEVEHMLKELSDYYSNEVDNTMKNFSTIIEPVIILVLGLAVAGIAVAVIMPMYSLAESF